MPLGTLVVSAQKTIFSLIFFLSITIFIQPANAEGFSNKKPAEIKISRSTDLKRLVHKKIIIDKATKNTVNVYVSPEEYDLLKRSGFNILWLPETAKLAHDNYFKNRTLARTKATGLYYPTYTELTTELVNLASDFPAIFKLESAGQSVQGRELWWVKISDNVNTEEAEPEVHYISTMHGDEPVGTVLCMEFVKLLTAGYSTDTEIQTLVNSTEIWIMPLMNPDGYEEGERWNANGKDLNRTFPNPLPSSSDTYNSTAERPPEVTAVMAWSLNHTPVLSANFHTGALVINYPMDYTQSLCPDNDLFEYISLSYAELNTELNNAPDPGYASDGIIRGAVWYEVQGSMQDWAYIAAGGNQITIELSSVKWPDSSLLGGFWDDNKNSMINYLQSVHCGVKGIVTDKDSGDPVSAWIRVAEIDHTVYTDPDVGDYHRMLLPGDYTLMVRANGYQSFSQDISITEGTVLQLDVQLETGIDTSGDNGNNWPVKTGGGGSTTPPSQDNDQQDNDEDSGGGSSDCFISAIEP